MDELLPLLSVELRDGQVPTVKLAGQADFHNRHKIDEAFTRLMGQGHTRILVDMAELHYIDSSGLSTLIRYAMGVADMGGSVKLVGASRQVCRALTLCGAAALFESEVPDVPVARETEAAGPAPGYWHVSHFCLPASPEAVPVARGRVDDVLRSLPMSSRDAEDVRSAVGEALTNAVRHGCGCDSGKSVSVKCVAGPRRVSIEVADPGNGFDPEAVPPPSPETLVEGGMGIHIMRSLMDEVVFDFKQGTTVKMLKRIRQTFHAQSSAGLAATWHPLLPQEDRIKQVVARNGSP